MKRLLFLIAAGFSASPSPDRAADVGGGLQQQLQTETENRQNKDRFQHSHSATSCFDCLSRAPSYACSTRLPVPGVPDPPHAHRSRRRRCRCRHHLAPPCFRWVLLFIKRRSRHFSEVLQFFSENFSGSLPVHGIRRRPLG